MKKDVTPSSFSARVLLAVVIAAGMLAGCSKVPDTIKIGVAQPLSGPLAALGQDLLNGVTLAVEELNKTGFSVDGKRVALEVVSMDDQASAEQGKAVAQQLADAGVVAVIGHLNSGVSIEAAPVYGAKDIAQLAISTNPRFTQLGLPTTLRLVANDTLQARAIGSFAATQIGGARYATLDDGTPYGKGLAEGAAEQLTAENKSVVLRRSFDDRTVAFDALAQELKGAQVDVIVSTLSDFQVLALLQALRKVGHSQVHVLGGDTIKTTDMVQGMGLVSGIYATSPVLEAKEFASGRRFLEKYEGRFQKAPAYGAHYTYDSTYVLSAAIQKAKSAKPGDVTRALRSISGYAPVMGTMSWDDRGEQRYGAVGVYELRAGAWELRMRSDRW